MHVWWFNNSYIQLCGGGGRRRGKGGPWQAAAGYATHGFGQGQPQSCLSHDIMSLRHLRLHGCRCLLMENDELHPGSCVGCGVASVLEGWQAQVLEGLGEPGLLLAEGLFHNDLLVCKSLTRVRDAITLASCGSPGDSGLACHGEVTTCQLA